MGTVEYNELRSDQFDLSWLKTAFVNWYNPSPAKFFRDSLEFLKSS